LDLRQAIKKGEYFETIKEMAYCRATSAFTFPVVVREFKVRTVGDYGRIQPSSVWGRARRLTYLNP
jgi:hypothetical protein